MIGDDLFDGLEDGRSRTVVRIHEAGMDLNAVRDTREVCWVEVSPEEVGVNL